MLSTFYWRQLAFSSFSTHLHRSVNWTLQSFLGDAGFKALSTQAPPNCFAPASSVHVSLPFHSPSQKYISLCRFGGSLRRWKNLNTKQYCQTELHCWAVTVLSSLVCPVSEFNSYFANTWRRMFSQGNDPSIFWVGPSIHVSVLLGWRIVLLLVGLKGRS